MEYQRPIVLSIAGFDPTGGAGLLADVKTMEQHRCMGFGVVSGLTVQTEDTFYNTQWLPLQQIKEQAIPLFDKYRIDVVKIGIIESFEVLSALVTWLKEQSSNLKIIWDTVLAASASGFTFIKQIDKEVLNNILKQLFLITPNTNEARSLSGNDDEYSAAQMLAACCSVYLKGGHSALAKGTDHLYTADDMIMITPQHTDLPAKHGSGCILSSAIAANLALGYELPEACRNAKTYIEKAMNSNHQLLAYHHV